MRYSSLLRSAKVTIIIILILISGFIIYLSKGEKMDEKLAVAVCAKLIHEYLENDFKIIKSNFAYSYRLNLSKIDLTIEYKNMSQYTSNCTYKKRFSNSTIFLKKAILIDRNGKITVFDDVKMNYNP